MTLTYELASIGQDAWHCWMFKSKVISVTSYCMCMRSHTQQSDHTTQTTKL